MDAETESEEAFKARFARQLKAARNDLGLSQVAMAKKLQCSESMYPKYENRDHFPLWLLPQLIKITDKPMSYWIFGVPHAPISEKTTPRRLKVIK